MTICLLLGITATAGAAGDVRNMTTGFGCTLLAREPEIREGEIHTPVRVECTTPVRRREVVTLLQQRRAGSFETVPGTRLIFDAPELIAGDAFMMEHSAFGWPVPCRSIAGLQEFRTVVKIRVGHETSPRIFSIPSQLPQDCFGDDFAPILSADDTVLASMCETPPMTDEAVAASLAPPAAAAATPGHDASDAVMSDPLEAVFLPLADLPAGEPADAETVTALAALEAEFADCQNAGELRRAASLLAGEFLREFLDLTVVEGFPGNRFEHPYPFPVDERLASALVQDARVLPDGRVGAVVEWVKASDPQDETSGEPYRELNFHVYERVAGQWRIAISIPIYV
jgi:hypothetical protein